MNRRISIPKAPVLFFVALFALIITAVAYSVPDDTIVYVTPSGEKYHREDCSYTTTVRPLTIEEAERKGYGACSRCDPDVLTGEYRPKQSNNSRPSVNSGGSTTNRTQSTPKKEVATAITEAPKVEEKPSFGDMIVYLIIGIYIIGSFLFAPGIWFFCGGAFDRIRDIFKKK